LPVERRDEANEREREREAGRGGGVQGAEKGAEKTHFTLKKQCWWWWWWWRVFFSFSKLTFAKWQNFLQTKLLLPKIINIYIMVLAKTS
jgi:hypothetical protein